jgi:transposase
MIEVEFASGARMRIAGAADPAMVSAILKTLAKDVGRRCSRSRVACRSGWPRAYRHAPETLDVVPRQRLVTEHVREKFSCRACEKITQPPAPFHAIARGFAGPRLLAMILVDKYANHQPLNRRSGQYERKGIELPFSTMADHVGACAAVVMPALRTDQGARVRGQAHPRRRHTVPVLAKVKTRIGLWTYVRDDRPFGADPPAAVFFYSPDRAGIHPEQPDTAKSSRPTPTPGSTRSTDRSGWAARSRKPRAGRTAGASSSSLPISRRRRAVASRPRSRPWPWGRCRGSMPPSWPSGRSMACRRMTALPRAGRMSLVRELIDWMTGERARLSRHEVAKAFDYMLKRTGPFTRFFENGRICLSNNAAERALRGIALGRKAWLFAGSDHGGQRAAVVFTLIQTAKLNDVDPQAWLADVLARIADHNISDLAALLPWNWRHAIRSTKPPDAASGSDRPRGLERMLTLTACFLFHSGLMMIFLSVVHSLAYAWADDRERNVTVLTDETF